MTVATLAVDITDWVMSTSPRRPESPPARSHGTEVSWGAKPGADDGAESRSSVPQKARPRGTDFPSVAEWAAQEYAEINPDRPLTPLLLNIPPQRPVVTKEHFMRADDLGVVGGARQTEGASTERRP